MKIPVLVIGVAALISAGDLLRETNSHAAAARAAKAYAKGDYAAAARSYGEAQKASPSPRNAFNAATAEIAAGQREQGAAHMDAAIADPALRADALFNRGNGALAAKALDHAIRDYSEALRADPRHAAARRNLEIALRRRQSEQEQGARGKENQQGRSPQQQQQGQQQQQPGGRAPQQPGQPDLEALLRSVQQQEQEELRRMKGRAAEGRVGW